MKSGLLWYNQAGKPLAGAITDALDRYSQKFGTRATIAYVNRADLASAESVAIAGVTVEGKRSVIKGHVFIIAEQGGR